MYPAKAFLIVVLPRFVQLDDEVAEASDDEKEDKSADDITKDKLVKVAKKKKSAPANGGGKGRGKKAAS